MKIVIFGTTGSVKTSLAKAISSALSCNFLDLDELRFKANWEFVTDEEFIEKVQNFLTNNNQGSWVVAGNYSLVRPFLWKEASHLLWLNYSFVFNFSRLFIRTVKRALTQEDVFPDCKESFAKSFFSKDSILNWFFKTYWKRRRAYPVLLEKYPNKEIVILKNQEESDTFLKQLSQ